MASDLCVITSYFNPCRYRTKRENYDVFMAGMKKAGARVRVVELAFADEPFELEPSEEVIHLRGDGVMWQKERLLNIAVERLPDDVTKVAWLDNDLIFDDPRWLERTSKELDRFMVVQPFSSCIRLERGEREYDGSDDIYESFGHCFQRAPKIARQFNFRHHGHTGFAWACRRELIEKYGLYEACLTGSGDHLMSHAFVGGYRHSVCTPQVIGDQPAYLKHYYDWSDPVRDMVDGKVGSVPGTLLHLWHGDLANRRYTDMNNQFMTFNFDPARHLTTDSSGLLDFSDQAPKRLRDWATEFFWLRREDGDPADEADARVEAAAARA